MKSVVWSDSGEAKQATEVLLPMWTEPGLDDALELLGPTFKDPRVRAFAVKLLERAEDEVGFRKESQRCVRFVLECENFEFANF